MTKVQLTTPSIMTSLPQGDWLIALKISLGKY
jgi:hypothetical protein